ncbi:MAG TPA: long-chain fatty acid--CoA ligase [Pyrinomonadaceae bacterium]|jgi:long-chain acyl-CoA synthetase
MSQQVEASSNFQSLPAMCLAGVRRHGKPDALNRKRDGRWERISAGEFLTRIERVALGLFELGIRPGDRVGLLSENRPEWSIVDLAILSLGAVNVPIYTTQAVEQVRYILGDSGARLLFVSGKRVFKHARPGVDGLEQLERIIFFDEGAHEGIERGGALSEIEELGRARAEREPEAFERLLAAVSLDDLATIIYTSGTTGEPKGVMLSHNNFVSNVQSIAGSLPIYTSDVALSVLPLSHIFERAVFYVFCYSGVSVHYSASFDQVGEHLREVRPTIMTAVPRLFEKVYHKIVKRGMSAKGWKRKVFEDAMQTGLRYAELKDKRQRVPLYLKFRQSVADRLVFSKWREGVGGRLRFFVSGGAPLSPTLSFSFMAAGIPVLQGYGMTETCIVSANRPEDNQVGSVGLVFPGMEVKIAEDGEIIVRGPNIMRGYYGKPEETAQVLEDGWFATGDVGRMDERGHLYITDRKKDLFKLSNGKYIAPQLVESLIKQSELVSQVVVIGAGRKQPAALIVPDWEALMEALQKNGSEPPKSRAELSRAPDAVKIVQREITQLTTELADYERVRRVALLPEEFTIDGGELTPTLKVKRRVVDEKYSDLIDELYGASE